MEPIRETLLLVARQEIGVAERSGRNDGPRIGEYLAYCGLPEGHAWCAAFVSWCYGQAVLPEPRNPWSPSLLPRARRLAQVDQARPGDVFGLYSQELGRVHHVGLVERLENAYLLSIEGNSRDRVERRRRPLRTVHAVADWVSDRDGNGRVSDSSSSGKEGER